MIQGLIGLTTFIALAALCSEQRNAIRWRMVAAGLTLQFLIAALLLKFPGIQHTFLVLNKLVTTLETASTAGSSYMFGYLGGAPLPFATIEGASSYIIAFRILPLVVVMSALSALLFHWGILQKFVHAFAAILRRTMGAGGAMGLGVAASIFLGIIEMPVLIKPYLARMNRSELFTIITAGMSTVAGTVMILYASVLAPIVDDAIAHILIASLISAPACVLIAQILIPISGTTTDGDFANAPTAHSSIDALMQGTSEGIAMVLQIVGVLIVLFALVSLVNQGLALIPTTHTPMTLQTLAGYLFAPFCWLMGIPWNEALQAGMLMGTKTMLNEFVAYLEFAKLPPETFSMHSKMILTYAMCGFANFGSLGIIVGGVGAMIPERRKEIIGLSTKAVAAGAVSTMMTGTIIGLLI